MKSSERSCDQCGQPLGGRRRSYCSDRCRRRWNRENRTTDTDAYAGFVARAVGAIGRRRPAEIDTLAALRNVQWALDEAIEVEVQRLRRTDASWSEIGEALGISKQAAQQRYGRFGGTRRPGGQPAHLR